jgi:CRP-like cAMP-binding protein
VELRVHALLWHLADRFGRVTPDGVHLPVPLTHRTIGSLVGARRPTVTLAVGELERAGTVHRDGLGGWLLRPATSELRDPATPPALATGAAA